MLTPPPNRIFRRLSTAAPTSSVRQVVILAMLLISGRAVPAARGAVVTPLVTYSNPVPIGGEKFGSYVYANGTNAFVSDSDAQEDGLGGAVYQFELTTGALIRTFGSPEGDNETNFGDRGAVAVLGDNLLVGDWGAQRVCFPNGNSCLGGLGYRFSISSGAHLETYSPVGHGGTLTGGAYAAGICGVGDRVVVGWPIIRGLEVFDAAGGFLVRYDNPNWENGSGSPIKPLGSSAVVVGTGGSSSTTRLVQIVDVATGATLATLADPYPNGGIVPSLFGESVATNAAGTRILVGAYRGSTAPGEGPGAAYLYDDSGDLLLAIDAPPGATGYFGWDVEFLGDDLLIAAPTSNANTGAVVLVDAETGSVLRLYDGYFGGGMFGYSLGAVDSSRFLVGSQGSGAWLLPGVAEPCTLSVDQGPVPALLSTCVAGTASFNVVASGTASITYQWRKDTVDLVDGPTGSGSTVSGSVTVTLTIADATPADQGSYDCVVTNPCDTVTSEAATLTFCAANLDGNNVVDLADHALFVECLGGPGTPLIPGCDCADVDTDGDVDLADNALFQAGFPCQ